MTIRKFAYSRSWPCLSSTGAMLQTVGSVLLFASVLAGCSGSEDEASRSESKGASTPTSQPPAKTAPPADTQAFAAPARWYTQENVSRGGPLFAEQCAACHGKAGEGEDGDDLLGSPPSLRRDRPASSADDEVEKLWQDEI